MYIQNYKYTTNAQIVKIEGNFSSIAHVKNTVKANFIIPEGAREGY